MKETEQIVVVTGGAGFIGTNLCASLVAARYQVVVIDDLSVGLKERLPAGVRLIVADVLDQAVLTSACVGASAIIHLASRPRVQDTIDDPTATHRVNVDGTLAVLEAARQAQVKRVIFASSSAVYGDQSVTPLHETLPPHPQSPYALHKYIGESYARLWHDLYGVATVSLRFFNVYGPHFDPSGPYALVIGRFLAQKARGEPLTITGNGEQTRDFIHVRDVVGAIVAVLTADTIGHGEVLNIGSGIATSINTLASLIGGPVTYVPPRLEPQHTCADVTKAKQRLAWQPTVTLDKGIYELARWYKTVVPSASRTLL
jgi:UDP-glucose 4-epimerase